MGGKGMNGSKLASRLLALLAVLAALVTAALCVYAVHQPPVLLTRPAEAEELAVQLMEDISRGDFDAASKAMLGNPDLGPARQPEGVVGKLLWQGFLDSFTYEYSGNCYAADSGVAMDLQVSYLDISSVIRGMGQQAGTLLKERVRRAEDMDDIYDEHNEYREDLVQEILTQATKQALQKEQPVSRSLTLQMTFAEGRWWVVPDAQLLGVLSGGTVG